MNRISLKANFEQIEEFNSSFLRTKIKVFAFGNNRNGSNITESAFDIARNSIFNIPVVAKFTDVEDKYGNQGDLEGHNTYLTRDKDGNLTIKQDTYPIGVVSSDASLIFEDVNEGTEENPDIKTYVVIDGVYLWKRYEAVEKIQEWLGNGIQPKVSMEIGNINGEYSKEKGSYMINAFEFEAIATLGSDIEPCFPMAQIEIYSQQTFEDSFYEMLKELKFSLQNQPQSLVEDDDINASNEGGLQVDQVLEMLQKYSLTIEQLSEKGINHEEFSVEDLEAKVQEMFAQNQETAQETIQEQEVIPTNTFALTSEQLEDELRRELAEIEILSDPYWEDYKYPRYCYVDNKLDVNVVIAWDCKNSYLVGGVFTVTNDNVEINADSLVRYKADYNPMDLSGDTDDQGEDDGVVLIPDEVSDYKLKVKEFELKKQFEVDKETAVNEVKSSLESLQSEFATLQEKYSALEVKASAMDSELTAKAQQEREEAETALFELFVDKLTEEEMAEIKANKAEMSLQEIEKGLKIAFAEKALKFSFNGSKDKDSKPLRYSIVNETVKPVSDKSYADLIKVKE